MMNPDNFWSCFFRWIFVVFVSSIAMGVALAGATLVGISILLGFSDGTKYYALENFTLFQFAVLSLVQGVPIGTYVFIKERKDLLRGNLPPIEKKNKKWWK